MLETTSAQYTVSGSEDRTLDPLTRTTYDNFARVASVIDPLNNVTSFGYDRNSNVVLATNPNGVQTAATYDHLDRVVTVTEAVGKAEQRCTGYAYDDADNMTSAADPDGGYTLTYDSLNRTVGVRGHVSNRRPGVSAARRREAGHVTPTAAAAEERNESADAALPWPGPHPVWENARGITPA